jgi:hypothetical protein
MQTKKSLSFFTFCLTGKNKRFFPRDLVNELSQNIAQGNND